MKAQFLLWIAVIVGVNLAGCPSGTSTLQTVPSADTNTPDTTPSTTDNTSSSGNATGNLPSTGNSSSGGTATAGTSFEAQLNATFPSCGEVANAARLRLQILNLVNQARMAEGLLPVSQNQTLEEQATQYACEMIEYDFFAHDNPFTGSNLADRAREFDYEYLVIGENLAAGQPTAERAFSDWMDSPGHRANILDERFTELGIGIRSGGSYGLYWVQEFGRPVDDPFRSRP